MDLVLNEDQELIAKTARDFVDEFSPIARFRTLRDEGEALCYSRPLFKEMAELGWVGIPFDEAHGGAGMGFAELVLVVEALGRNLAPEPFLGNVALAGSALALGGSTELQNAWLPGLIEGNKFLALAHQEPRARYDLFSIETTATASGAGFKLSGEKIQVLDAVGADAIIVPARVSGHAGDRDGISLFLVPSNASGLSIEGQTRLDHRNSAIVKLKDVEVAASAVVGEPGAGGALLESAVDRATVVLCAEMLGGMSQSFDLTLEYLKTRDQFGVKIGTFQALKHRAAEVYMAIELCRSTVMAAARAIDAGAEDIARLVSLAKAKCADAYVLATNEGVQIFAGVGMTDEYDIGFFMKRARASEVTFGDATVSSESLGYTRQLLDQERLRGARHPDPLGSCILNPKERLLRSCRGEAVDRPPVWLMRQAGRYLPEYRAVRKGVTFLEMCADVERATTVSLQPIDLVGAEAVILFQDIFTPIPSMGVDLDFAPGPVMAEPIRTAAQVDALEVRDPREAVPFVFEILGRLRKELDPREIPLLGFAGAPFTLAAYMIQGSGSKDFSILKAMLHKEPEVVEALLEKLCTLTIEYLKAQIEAGAEAVQLFDTWAGLLDPEAYGRWAHPYHARIAEALKGAGAPLILYVQAGSHVVEQMADSGVDVVSLDWRLDLAKVVRSIGDRVSVQGNLDPCSLHAPRERIFEMVREMAEAAAPARGHILNLGHGCLPDTPVEGVRAFTDAARALGGESTS